MNRYVAQGDGFPADNDFLMFIQDIITQVSQLASIGGEFYIIKGCEIAGGNVNPGWMVLNGEPIYFEGGALGAQVTIIENIEQVSYLEDLNNDGQGDSKNAYFSRVARFGNNGVATFDWSDIERINPLAELSKRVLPPGTNPQLYSGSVITFLQDGSFVTEPITHRI